VLEWRGAVGGGVWGSMGWRRKWIGGVALRLAGVGTGWWSRSGRGTQRVSSEVADTLSAKLAHGD
jgi:hypothetical protein